MPVETAPLPSAPAAPAAVPAAPSTPPISSLTKKPISEAAHKLFTMLEESSRPVPDDDEVTPEPEKVTPPAAATAAVVPATPEEKPVKVSKRAPKRPDLPIDKPAEPATPAAPAAPPDANWEEGLLDDEKAALEDARLAETVNPAKHKGLADKMGKFFRDQKKYLTDHPDADDEDPRYKALLATMPAISAADKREISDARIEGRVAKRYDSKIVDLQHELYVRDEEPKVEAEAAQIRRHMAFNALPAEMLTMLKDKGLPVLQKEYADELEVAGGLINTLTEDAKELLRITRLNPKTQRSLGSVATDESHPKWHQHNRISTMVNAVCDDFHNNAPQAEQVRDGKWFVTREEWGKLAPAARHQFWTFTNSDEHVREMITRAMGWMPGAINAEIQKRQEHLKQRGYVRHRAEAPAGTPAVPPQPSSSPATPRPAPAPSPSTAGGAPLTPGAMLARRLAGGG